MRFAGKGVVFIDLQAQKNQPGIPGLALNINILAFMA